MIIEKINSYLTSKGGEIPDAVLDDIAAKARSTFSRQFGVRNERTQALRLSSIGHCMRQQAYSFLGFEENGKEIDSRARMVFCQGDLVELVIVGLAKVAGCPIEDAQVDIELDGVPGHPDGVYKNHLVEIKSMSSFAFEKFQLGEIDLGYRYQINAYMEALGLDRTIMIGQNKDAGVLHENIVTKDQNIVKDIRDRISILKQATKENIPAQGYHPDEKGFLPWNCLYCGFWKTCRPNAEKVLVRNRYKLKEAVCLSTPSK